jgi:hypothetical protein
VPGKQQGRLVFDFDFTEMWYGIGFVPRNFQSTIENLVCGTFSRYYEGVDLSRLVFVWLISDVEKKWSKHLIVKNAHFCDDWKEQSLIFYNLLLALYEEVNPWPEPHGLKVDQLIDIQVARGNATMRMMGSSKLGGKTLRLDSPPEEKKITIDLSSGEESEDTIKRRLEGSSGCSNDEQSDSSEDTIKRRLEEKPTEEKDSPFTFYDTLIQLYRREEATTEQNIRQSQLRRKILDEMFYTYDKEKNEDVPKQIPNKFYRKACKHAMIDLTKYEHDDRSLESAEVQKAFATFEDHMCREMKVGKQAIFRFKGCKGCLISLERVSSAPCLLSGKVHDNENAFLRVGADGGVYFHCLRGCELGDKKSIRLFGTI